MNPYWADNISDRDPFSFENVYRYPDEELGRYKSDHGGGSRVAVIGGGVAGLTAAFELQRHGYTVSVLEESDRIGGRVWTRRFNDGTHAEFGAMRIPSSHLCTLHYAQEFDLQLRTFVNYNSAAFYRLRGRTVRVEDWRDAASDYDLSGFERRDPTRLLESQMNLAMARLSAPEKYRLFHSRTPGIVQEYDNRTLRQHLEAAGLSSDAIEFLGQATGLIQYERASFLETLVDYFGLLRVQQYEIVDGMDALTQAFASKLNGCINLNTSVVAVNLNGRGVDIVTRERDQQRTEVFDYVICTAPARRTAMIDWSPRLPNRQTEALRNLYYASAAKTIMHVSERPWELHDGIFGGGSFSDEPFQQIWYPSDNAAPSPDSIQRATITGDDEDATATASAPTRWVAIDPAVSSSPAAVTASYTWENNARLMGAMTDDERTDYVVRAFSRMHPEVEEHIIDVEHVVWDQQGGMSGAFAYFAPGEHSRLLEVIRQPQPLDSPRVFFAGEHVSATHAWIQGSIQSALEATLGLMSRKVSAR